MEKINVQSHTLPIFSLTSSILILLLARTINYSLNVKRVASGQKSERSETEDNTFLSGKISQSVEVNFHFEKSGILLSNYNFHSFQSGFPLKNMLSFVLTPWTSGNSLICI